MTREEIEQLDNTEPYSFETDREEPKFKVGDKVRKDNDYLTYLIDNIEDGFYKLVAIGEDGNRGCTSYFNVKYQTELKVVEEPVSEELEEEILSYWRNELTTEDVVSIDRECFAYIARHFAEWQKQKDKQLVGATQKISYQHGYDEGRIDMREEMMKDAVEGEVRKGYVGNQIVIHSKDNSAKYVAFDASYADEFCVGDKVKIIIAKEECYGR